MGLERKETKNTPPGNCGGKVRDNPDWLNWAADRARERLEERKYMRKNLLSKVIIADVYYSITDETYYVLNGESKYSKSYKSVSFGNTVEILKEDGWELCGKVSRSDYF